MEKKLRIIWIIAIIFFFLGMMVIVAGIIPVLYENHVWYAFFESILIYALIDAIVTGISLVIIPIILVKRTRKLLKENVKLLKEIKEIKEKFDQEKINEK